MHEMWTSDGFWAFAGVFVTQVVFFLLNRKQRALVRKELTHNGGSSTKDAAKKAADTAGRIEGKLDSFMDESRRDRATIWSTLVQNGIHPKG